MAKLIVRSEPMSRRTFRRYDVRGIVGKEITTGLAYDIGRAFGTFLTRRRIEYPTVGLGRDARFSSSALHKACLHGLVDSGCQVLDINVVATPVLNFAVADLGLDGGIMITASHHPPQYNGFKMAVADAYPVAGQDIDEIVRVIEESDFIGGWGGCIQADIRERYISHLLRLVKFARPLKVVIDAGNGVAGLFACDLFRRLGCQVVDIYCEPDGSFPYHQPDPEKPENLRQLQNAVLNTRADIGIAFDGDMDRLGVVNERGEIYDADRVLILLSRDLLSRHPGARIMMDVKSSQLVFDDVLRHGGRPVYGETGHSMIKRRMHAERDILLAGEYSGHIFPAEDYYIIDDALLASCRLLDYLSRSGGSLSALLGSLPKKFSTGTVEIPCVDCDRESVVLSLIEAFSRDFRVLTIDGVRVDFGDGWALVRSSNTSDNLVLRFEADTRERLRDIQSLVYRHLSTLLPSSVLACCRYS